MVTWEKASREVIRTAENLIEEFHPWLKNARVGFMFRSEAPKQNGKEVWGKAEKVSDKWRELLDEPLDFIIWLAKDVWDERLDMRQKRALIDHKLCHCMIENGEAKMRPHDVEEFTCIIERHGLWKKDLEKMARVVEGVYQPSFLFGGGVVSVELKKAESLP